jgi:hypothetical protein
MMDEIDRFTPVVIPAKAGIHISVKRTAQQWIPAFAGMTVFVITPIRGKEQVNV